MRLFFFAVLCLLGAALAAQTPFRPSLELGLSWSGGTASYELASTESSTNVYSQLDFGWPALWAGATAEAAAGDDPARGLRLRAEVFVALAASPEPMVDQDWVSSDSTPQVPRTLFSYTESDTSAGGVRGGLAGRWSWAGGTGWAADLRAGVDAALVRWTSSSIQGWAYDIFGTGALGTYDENGYTVLTYQLFWVRPSAGLGLRFFPDSGWEVALWADGAAVGAADEDDHVLRTKLSTAAGVGWGWDAGLESTFTFAWLGGDLLLKTGLSAAAFRAEGTQVQEWYGDAEAAYGAPRGTRLTGIDHAIVVATRSVTVSAGYRW